MKCRYVNFLCCYGGAAVHHCSDLCSLDQGADGVCWEDWHAFDVLDRNRDGVIDRDEFAYATTGGLFQRDTDITHWSQIGEDLEYRGAMMRAPESARKNSPPRAAQAARGAGLTRVELAKQQGNKETFKWKHTMPNPGNETPHAVDKLPPSNYGNLGPSAPSGSGQETTAEGSVHSTPRAPHQARFEVRTLKVGADRCCC